MRREIAMQLFDLLPAATIARVCNLTVEQVFALVRQSESGGTVTENHSNAKPPHRIKLLDQPISRITVPMANSTKHAMERQKEAFAKLKEYLKG